MAQNIQLADGRVILIANYPAVNNSSEIWKDPITGKIFLAGSVSIIKDSFTWTLTPNENYGLIASLALRNWADGNQINMYAGNLAINKNLLCYCNLKEGSGSITYSVYEILNDWGETDITWNTQPTPGNLLGIFSSGIVNTWWSFPTGTTESIAIIGTQEPSIPGVRSIIQFVSTNSTDITKRPYISEP